MDQLMQAFSNAGTASAGGGPETVALALLLAFCLGHLVAWVYMWTYAEMSYSRTFVLSLVVLPVVVSLLMMLMSGDIVVAFGLLAVFAVVRFRNVLKDTRDTVFVLWVMVIGMGIGTLSFSTTLIGSFFIALVLLYLRFVWFGKRQLHDATLLVNWTGSETSMGDLPTVLNRFCARFDLAQQRKIGDGVLAVSYRLRLRDPDRAQELAETLRTTPGVAEASVLSGADQREM